MQLAEEPTAFVSMPQGEVAYWRIGTPGGLPIVCLHGGPGLPHSYLEPLADLGADREVILYDQAGCGRSGRQAPAAGWSMDYFVAELGALVTSLDLGSFHLFGNSWGGWLALEYVLGDPLVRPVSLSLNSSPPSVARWVTDMHELRAQLPPDLARTMERHEQAGTTASREYKDAFRVFNSRHLCRLQPWPDSLKRATKAFGDEVYKELWGASEFGPVTGAMAGWDVTPRLRDVRLPTYVSCGRHDEATPAHVSVLADHIAGASFRVFENSSHMAFLEERDAFIAELAQFVRSVDE